MRSHGKWGDFLVALIPLSWCGNILINSNFILRMLEWQNESSLFVIRIQGKQWYWVYKYNADTAFRLNNIFINVGNNNWSPLTVNSSFYFNANNRLSSFIYDYEFKKIHKESLKNSKLFKLTTRQPSLITHNKNFCTIQLNNKNNKQINNLIFTSLKNINANYFNKNTNFSNLNFLEKKTVKFFNTTKNSWNLNFTKFKTLKTKVEYSPKINLFQKTHSNLSFFETDKLDNSFISAESIRLQSNKFTIKLVKGVLNKHNINTLKNSLNFTKPLLFNTQILTSDIALKPAHVEQFWGFRQKKYKKLRPHSFLQNTKYFDENIKNLNLATNKQKFNKYFLYTAVKNNRYKNELISVTLARRLLRTKRTLILPVHINLTLITNSYDVVHSWFVPGLGLKIDCVPGRSTHHSLFIDSVGFYYGQCAEICGRYHHHMPIRVCALPFEHFMLWWQTKGLPRTLRSTKLLNNKSTLLFKLYL